MIGIASPNMGLLGSENPGRQEMSQYQSETLIQTANAASVQIAAETGEKELTSGAPFFEHWLKSDHASSRILDKVENYSLHPGAATPGSLFRANAKGPDVNKMIEMAASLCGANSQKTEFRAHLLRSRAQSLAESEQAPEAGEVSKARLKAEHALEDALEALRPYALEQERLDAEKLINNIERQKLHPLACAELAEARVRLATAKDELRRNKPQYTKSLKALKRYAHLVLNYCKLEPDKIQARISSICAVEELERMMGPVETAWKGIPGRSLDLPRTIPAEMTEFERLEQIRDHLEVKVNAIDAKQNQRLEKIATHPVIEAILAKHDEGALPEEGSIFFFTTDGRPLYRIDANRPKPRPGQSIEDATRHATKTPEFIDIARLKGGFGPDGAGLFRFAELADLISGAVVLSPVIRDGKKVQLPGMSKPKRVVSETIGSVPEFIDAGMPYSAILNRFRRAAEDLFEKCIQEMGRGSLDDRRAKSA